MSVVLSEIDRVEGRTKDPLNGGMSIRVRFEAPRPDVRSRHSQRRSRVTSLLARAVPPRRPGERPARPHTELSISRGFNLVAPDCRVPESRCLSCVFLRVRRRCARPRSRAKSPSMRRRQEKFPWLLFGMSPVSASDQVQVVKLTAYSSW